MHEAVFAQIPEESCLVCWKHLQKNVGIFINQEIIALILFLGLTWILCHHHSCTGAQLAARARLMPRLSTTEWEQDMLFKPIGSAPRCSLYGLVQEGIFELIVARREIDI